jgi:hypothetical protein
MKLIVAGGRDFNNYEFLCESLDFMLSKFEKKDISIVCGMARGADALGRRYGIARGFNIIEMPANWKDLGKRAGYHRNEQMAKVATHCVVFWDGESKGSKHMIKLAGDYLLPCKIYRYS